MDKAVFKLVCTLLLAGGMCAVDLAAQQPTQSEEGAYDSKFFLQLRNIFGRFRDSDLQRVFQDAKPIQCSELVGRKGEWRQVAFFNEDRSLGDWYRDSIDEVKEDLAVYTFKGVCSGDQGKIQVTTEFPTAASLDDYTQQRIKFDQVDVTVNDPVDAVLNPRTMAYTFNLPYLFLRERGSRKIYSFIAPDRYAVYAAEVTSRWECKAVASDDVTYRFLICRVSTLPQHVARNEKWSPAFGSSAFFILSDGTEAQTSVHLTYGDAGESPEKPADIAPASASPQRPTLKRK
jgi:hypothetical protein